jgi:hypothetical protein
MSMFSTKGGLYERARKRFKIADGIKLFSYPFYKQRRQEVQVRTRARLWALVLVLVCGSRGGSYWWWGEEARLTTGSRGGRCCSPPHSR